MTMEQFAQRLSSILQAANTTERDLSLRLGHNPGYINAICTQKSFPSMELFFDICDELNITPLDFFEEQNTNPSKINELLPYLNAINPKEFDNISSIIKALADKEKTNDSEK